MDIAVVVLEVIMILCFGASWPFNLVKSYRARTTKGKSLPFLILIFVGYIAGIVSKLLVFDVTEWLKWFVLFFYVLNFLMVGLDLCVYVRNYKLDRQREKELTEK